MTHTTIPAIPPTSACANTGRTNAVDGTAAAAISKDRGIARRGGAIMAGRVAVLLVGGGVAPGMWGVRANTAIHLAVTTAALEGETTAATEHYTPLDSLRRLAETSNRSVGGTVSRGGSNGQSAPRTNHNGGGGSAPSTSGGGGGRGWIVEEHGFDTDLCGDTMGNSWEC